MTARQFPGYVRVSSNLHKQSMEEEQAVDDLVRTVACPNCERPAGVRCWRESEIRGGSCYSCTGRYTAAWIAELVPPIAGYHVSFEEYEELRG